MGWGKRFGDFIEREVVPQANRLGGFIEREVVPQANRLGDFVNREVMSTVEEQEERLKDFAKDAERHIGEQAVRVKDYFTKVKSADDVCKLVNHTDLCNLEQEIDPARITIFLKCLDSMVEVRQPKDIYVYPGNTTIDLSKTEVSNIDALMLHSITNIKSDDKLDLDTGTLLCMPDFSCSIMLIGVQPDALTSECFTFCVGLEK